MHPRPRARLRPRGPRLGRRRWLLLSGSGAVAGGSALLAALSGVDEDANSAGLDLAELEAFAARGPGHLAPWVGELLRLALADGDQRLLPLFRELDAHARGLGGDAGKELAQLVAIGLDILGGAEAREAPALEAADGR